MKRFISAGICTAGICISSAGAAGDTYFLQKSLNTYTYPNGNGTYSSYQLPPTYRPEASDYYGPHSEIPKCTSPQGISLPDEECELFQKYGYDGLPTPH